MVLSQCLQMNVIRLTSLSVEFVSGFYSFLNELHGCREHELSVLFADMKYNFNKIATLNQGTPYDYNSVMQYHRYVTGLGYLSKST